MGVVVVGWVGGDWCLQSTVRKASRAAASKNVCGLAGIDECNSSCCGYGFGTWGHPEDARFFLSPSCSRVVMGSCGL